MNAAMTQPRTFWPWGIVLGLALGVGVLSTMATIAIRHRSAVVPGDPDRDALDYDRVLAARQAATQLGWSIQLAPCTRIEAGVCALELEVLDREGTALAGVEGEVSVARSDDARWDRSAAVEAAANGYRVPLQLGAGGLYRVSLRLDRGDEHWVGERELLLVAD